MLPLWIGRMLALALLPALAMTTAAQSPGPALQKPTPVVADPATVSLAPGDVVTVNVFGRPELTTTVYVSDRGEIDVPLAGPIQVAGLSPSQASERVATAYRQGQFLVDPQVNIVLAGLRSQQISVLGEVVKPGRYPIDTRTTVLDALAQAGGIKEVGAQKVFVLRRAGEDTQRLEIDLAGVFETGSGPIAELRAGDTLIVPRARLFYIYGEVRSPNSYVLRPHLTAIEAISMAGGLTPRGSSRRIEVKRKTADGELQTLSLDLDDAIQADDVINVKERLF